MPRLYAVLCGVCLAMGFTLGRGTAPVREVHPTYGITEKANALTRDLLNKTKAKLTPCEQIAVMTAFAQHEREEITDERFQALLQFVVDSSNLRQLFERRLKD
jgi:hypothetical protein